MYIVQVQCNLVYYGSFTLVDTAIHTDINKLCTELNKNLNRTLSLCSMNNSTQFYVSHFYRSVSVIRLVPTEKYGLFKITTE